MLFLVLPLPGPSGAILDGVGEGKGASGVGSQCPEWISRYPPQHERGVIRAESDAIADGMFDLRATAGVRDIVEVAIGIGNLDVDGRWHLSVLHRDEGCGHARGTARTLRMTDLRFQ